MKKIISLLVCTLLLAACGNSGSSSDKVLEFWIPGGEDEYGFYYEAARQYSEMTDGVTIKPVQQPWSDYWTKLPLEINKDRGPSIFITHPSYSDVIDSLANELPFTSDELTKLGYTNVNEYLGENGNPMFIPVLYAPMQVFYNLDMWEAAGLTDADIPTNWEELAAISLKLKDDTKKVIGFDYSYHILYDLTIQNGLSLTDANGKATFSNDTLKTIVDWESKGVTNYMSFGAGSPEESFLQQSAAMIYGQPWMENYFKNTVADLRFGSFMMPAFEGAQKITTSQMELSPGISKSTKYQEESEAFLKWMLTNEQVMLDVANGNNAASANTNFIKKQNFDSKTAGAVSVETIEKNLDLLISVPSSYEQALSVLLENTISSNGTNIDADVKQMLKSLENADLTRMSKMEHAK